VHAGRDERQQHVQRDDYADPSVLSTQFGQILNAAGQADASFRAGESSSQRLVGDVAKGFNTFSQATAGKCAYATRAARASET